VPASVGWGQECIVVVGGLGSPTDASDVDFFGAALGDLQGSLDHRVVRFGVDRGAYDTLGSISRSGEELRSVIHAISSDCDAIHVLAHSMGGAVADRAFAKGDPAGDGVVTYIAMASPHNGATAARALRPGIELDETFAAGVSVAARTVGRPDPTKDAVRDLALIHAPRPVRGVAAVRAHLATDEFVLRRDNADRRFDAREYLPATLAQLEGHGGIVHNAQVQRVIRSAIRSHTVPPEDRPDSELRAAVSLSERFDATLAGVEGQLGARLIGAALVTKLASTVASAMRETGAALEATVEAVAEHLGESLFVVAPLGVPVLE